jgi:hypothetical protein
MPLIEADRKWNLLSDGLLPLALAAMRALWVWLLLDLWWHAQLAASSHSPGPAARNGELLGALTVFGLLWGGTLAAQLGVHAVRGDRQARLLVVGTGLVAAVLALYAGLEAAWPPAGMGPQPLWQGGWLRAVAARPGTAFTILAIAVWLWWWGILTGREPPGYDLFSRNFALGIAALAIGIAVAYATPGMPLRGALLTLLLFFAVGLGALAIASLQETRRYELRTSEQPLGLSRYWLGTVGAVIGVLLAAGVLLAQLFAPDAIARLLAPLTALTDLLGRAFIFILMAFAYLAFLPLSALARLLHFAPRNMQLPALTPMNLLQELGKRQNESAGLPASVRLALHILGGLLLLAIIAGLFAFAFRRLRPYGEEDVAEARESILTADLLKQQLARLLRRGKGKNATAEELFVRVQGDDPRAEVRRIYQALLAWAVIQGLPRPRGATPTEYAELVRKTLPAAGDEIDELTAVYLVARYDTAPLSTEAVEAARAAWGRIAANGK